MRRILAAAALAGVMSAAGCYRNTAGRDQPVTTVRVDNQSFYDFNIYVLPSGGTQTRLGLCPAKSKRDFVVPATIVTGSARSMRFVARPIATQVGPVSEDVTVSPGDTIGLQIPPG